jgi:hypothetical protein
LAGEVICKETVLRVLVDQLLPLIRQRLGLAQHTPVRRHGGLLQHEEERKKKKKEGGKKRRKKEIELGPICSRGGQKKGKKK